MVCSKLQDLVTFKQARMAFYIAALMACLGHTLCLTSYTVEESRLETVNFCLVTACYSLQVQALAMMVVDLVRGQHVRHCMQSHMCIYIYIYLYTYICMYTYIDVFTYRNL